MVVEPCAHSPTAVCPHRGVHQAFTTVQHRCITLAWHSLHMPLPLTEGFTLSGYVMAKYWQTLKFGCTAAETAKCQQRHPHRHLARLVGWFQPGKHLLYIHSNMPHWDSSYIQARKISKANCAMLSRCKDGLQRNQLLFISGSEAPGHNDSNFNTYFLSVHTTASTPRTQFPSHVAYD